MAFKLYEDTWETSTTTGTGSYTLAGAVTGWRPFSAQYANSDTCYYSAYDGSNFEEGVGTFVSATPALARTTIYRSSNGGAAVNWAAGTRNIVVAPLGIVIESLLTPGNTGYAKRTADNTWAYDLAGQISNVTATNDSAGAGKLGEFIESSVSAVAIANSTTTRTTTISLTAGDWDVWASLNLAPAGSTAVNNVASVIGLTDAVLSAVSAGASFNPQPISFTGGGPSWPVGKARVSVAGPTSIYLNSFVGYSVSTLTHGGYLAARRVR